MLCQQLLNPKDPRISVFVCLFTAKYNCRITATSTSSDIIFIAD